MPRPSPFPLRLHVRVSPDHLAYLKREAQKRRSMGAVVRDLLNVAMGASAVSGGAG